MKGYRFTKLCLGIAMLGASVSAQATLIGVLPATVNGTDYQAYYDTVANLTWLADANANGPMTWSAATTWAAALSVTGYAGASDITVNSWMLPSIMDTGTSGCNFADSGTDCGYNVQTTSGSTVYSAMASLYYDTLGNLAYCDTSGNCPQTGWGLANTGPFSNVQRYYYWSATEYAPNTGSAWFFLFYNGSQRSASKTYPLYAWAVAAGNVGDAVLTLKSTSVPEPGTLLLMSAGLIGLAGLRRRTRATPALPA